MKPAAWQVRDLRGGEGPWKQCSESAHEEYKNHSTVETRELYSAEQLAEAVAAERERIIKAIESERLEDTATDPTDLAYNTAIEHCLSAIRSTSK